MALPSDLMLAGESFSLFSSSASFSSIAIDSEVLWVRDTEDEAVHEEAEDEAEDKVEEELDGEVVTIRYNIGEQRTAVDGSSNPTKLIAGMLSWDRIKIRVQKLFFFSCSASAKILSLPSFSFPSFMDIGLWIPVGAISSAPSGVKAA